MSPTHYLCFPRCAIPFLCVNLPELLAPFHRQRQRTKQFVCVSKIAAFWAALNFRDSQALLLQGLPIWAVFSASGSPGSALSLSVSCWFALLGMYVDDLIGSRIGIIGTTNGVVDYRGLRPSALTTNTRPTAKRLLQTEMWQATNCSNVQASPGCCH